MWGRRGTGKVTAAAPGSTTIYAVTNDGGKTTRCDVTVVVPVTGVTLNKTFDAITAGTSDILVATVAPSNAANKSVTWSSSNTAVATVDSSGKVTAITAGTATITVTTADGGKTAACAVTVNAAIVYVTGVTLNKTTDTLTVGAADTLMATVNPSNATNKNVSWTSSNTAVATVDSTGKVTAVAAGSATITVTTADGGKTATCAVTVNAAPVPVTGITLNKTSDALIAGASDTLVATVAPSNATNKNVTWLSSNTAVATVDSNGKVTAVDSGTAMITVTTADGGKTAACAVTVTVPVTGVMLSLGSYTFVDAIGAGVLLTATVFPANATNKNVTWSSSNTAVATVNSTGNVIAVASGSATITVTTADGGKTATCTITVTVPVTGVTLSKTTTTLSVGNAEALVAIVAPSNATNKNVTWSSNSTAIATVDSAGVIKAIAPGIAMITVTTADGGKTATCAVTVEPPNNKLHLTVVSMAGKSYILAVDAQNIASFAGRTFTLTYDSALLKLDNFAAQTGGVYINAGAIPGTGITIISISGGTVTFSVDKTIPSGKTWSGTLTMLKFEGTSAAVTKVSIQ